MGAMAQEAERGGAAGLRINGPADAAAACQMTGLPSSRHLRAIRGGRARRPSPVTRRADYFMPAMILSSDSLDGRSLDVGT